MKLAWITDIHLNFLEVNDRTTFYDSISATDCNAVLLSGDIAEAPSVGDLLIEMVNDIKKPIYFVLGNHDYYRSNVTDVRASMTALMKSEKQLFWLSVSGMQLLDNDTMLLGQDGWADGRYGDYANTQVNLNDSRLINDLFQQNIRGKYRLLEKMQEMADKDAMLLHNELLLTIKKHQVKKIIILTHVPPFQELCFNKGKPMLDNYLPYFVSKAMGDVLLEVAKANFNIEFLVLCGHTHERACYQALNNLKVKVGEAKYGEPRVEEVVMI